MTESFRRRARGPLAFAGWLTVGLGWFALGPEASGWDLVSLASFKGTNGSLPYGGVTFDASGNLYGVTDGGGTAGYGTVYEIARGTNTISTLATFTGANGANPQSTLVLGPDGNFFGTTPGGGANGVGTVFQFNPGTHAITALASFASSTTGSTPLAGLTLDADGNLYGTASGGGKYNGGTVFEVAKGASTITAVAPLSGATGVSPRGGVVLDAAGNLYGVTYQGGAHGDGAIFEVAKGSSTATTLATFAGANGANPYGGLAIDANGNLYGTTYGGGANGDGTVFELVAGSSTIITLASFNGSNGASPYGALTIDASGNLYGTTYEGGASNKGTVFEVLNGSGTVTTLASFNGTDGAYPRAGVTLGGDGNLYGTTLDGGSSNIGTVFMVTPVPEPSSLALLAAAGAALAARHIRKPRL